MGRFDERGVVCARAGDRMVQLFYHQLPYHPERIQQGTMWTCELKEPGFSSGCGHGSPEHGRAASGNSEKKNIELHAYLDEELSSWDAKVGQQFQATVA